VTSREGPDPTAEATDDGPSDEAAHLLREPENARRLLAAIDRLEHGAGVPHDLVDPSG
jgi:antitoxin YefM